MPLGQECASSLYSFYKVVATRLVLYAFDMKEWLIFPPKLPKSSFLYSSSAAQQAVIRMRFGLDDGNPKTLEVIGKKFSVTRERIRQIEARALHKLRQPYRNHSVKCYVNDYS